MTPVARALDAATRLVEDFPIKGILFRDISPILENPRLFDLALEELARNLDLSQVDAFVGIESRGFILGAALSAKFKKGFIPLRKAGKLPPPVIAQSYDLEYGQATLELRVSPTAPRVVVIDDVLATGGTLRAAVSLCERAGMKIQDVRVLVDLIQLNQFRFNGKAIDAVLRY